MTSFSNNGLLGQTRTDQCIRALRWQGEMGLTDSSVRVSYRKAVEILILLGMVHFDVDATVLQRNLGDTIRGERLARNLSQEALAERCQLNRTYLGSVERGERNISIQNIVHIANALNIQVWKLIRTAEESKAAP